MTTVKNHVDLIWLIAKRNNLNKDLRKFLIVICLLEEYNSYRVSTLTLDYFRLEILFCKLENSKDACSLIVLKRVDYIDLCKNIYQLVN